MGHNGTPYDYVIHVALIAQSSLSLITSFQLPLTDIDLMHAYAIRKTDSKRKSGYYAAILSGKEDVVYGA